VAKRKKKNKNYLKYLLIISCSLILLIIILVVHSNYVRKEQEEAIKEDFRDKYDYDLNLIGYRLNKDVYESNNIRLSMYVDHNKDLVVELRNNKEFDIDLYVKTLKLFIDLDDNLIKDLINNLIKNSEEVENGSNINLDMRNYSLDIYSYPIDNLNVSVTFSINSNLSYSVYHYSKSLIDENTKLNNKILERINIENNDELVNYMINESIYNHDNNSLRYNEIFINVDNNNDYSYNLSYDKSNYSTESIRYSIVHNYDTYHDDIKKDLLLLDKYFNKYGKKTINYYEDIIKFVDLDSKDFTYQEDYNKDGYYYGKNDFDNLIITVNKYQNKIIMEYYIRGY